MKKALSVALLIALPALLLVAGTAQEEIAVPELFEQEVAAMEEAFGGLRAFMAELIGEVKWNMSDIDDLQAALAALSDFTEAIAIELKTAEGKIVGLQAGVAELGDGQEELRLRVVALEAGLAELSAFAEGCCRQLEAMIQLQGEELQGAMQRNREELQGAMQRNREELEGLIHANRADIEALIAELARLEQRFNRWAEDYAAFKEEFQAFQQIVLDDLASLHDDIDALAIRIQFLEDEDVGSFKKKVLELERNMAALSIKVDNNRTKLEGFDYAFAGFASDIELNASGLLSAMSLIEDHEVRIAAMEDGSTVAALQEQVNTLYFLSILGLLAGLGALIWTFMGSS
jgi:chromosome segregation ATPase